MTIDRKPTRYAHSDGHTDVCYSEDGQRLITCGTDGDIRIWSSFNDDDPVQTCVGEWSLCVRQKGEHLYVATDKNIVQLMTFPESERDGILARFTAHVNHLAVGKNDNVIAAAAEDMEVKVMHLSDSKEPSNVLSFPGLSGPPLSIAMCPKAKLLAVSSGDGNLRVWNIESASLLKEIDCVPKTNSFMNADLLCRIHFEPVSGRTLAYPNKNTVIIVDTTSWSNKIVLMCPEIEAPYSIVQFSPCGNLMAATTQQGDLVVWEIATQNVIDITKHPKSISLCAMVWNPNGNGEIAFCDVQGQLGIATNCVVSCTPEVPLEIASEINGERSENQVDFGEFQFEDDDDENAVSLEKLKNEVMGSEEPELNFDQESSRAPTPRARTPEMPLQSAFMPTSTPEHLNPRYLCWNDVGIVRCFGGDSDDDSNKSIEVEFHDASLHSSMMMQNYQGYTMGCLSTTALVVANANQITTIPLSAGSKEWTLTMLEEEEIICVAVSDYLVCFATNNYMIRVCSTYGTQKVVVSVPGPLVSMSAHGYFLLAAYHYGAARKGDQCINVMLIKSEGISVENKDIYSALRPETTLQWLGFTDLGTPAMQDSYGLLSLHPVSSNIWLPFCDTTKYRKNPGDGFFITAVSESLQAIRGIRCRGSIYPSFIPRPTLSEIPIEPPFIELATEKSQLEANLFTWSVLRVENVEKKLKETALKTFALACKNNLDQRALELIEMMANPQLLTLATKYATKLNRRRLAEKLMEMASSLQENDWEDSSFQSSVVTPSSNIKPANRKLVLNSSSKRNPKSKAAHNERAPTPEPVNNIDEEASTSAIIDQTQDENNVSLKNTSVADDSINSQNSSISQSHSKNPFLKSLKKSESTAYNPLSLLDKFAGYNVEERKKEKENKSSLYNASAEKRKKPPESDSEKPKDKQRKLDKFMFSKRS